MVTFNYAKYFDEQKIFDITKKEDMKSMKKVLNIISKIEEYFKDIFPNMDFVRPIISFSFKLNTDYNMNYIDRINYIIGIIYSKKYIDEDDVISFSNLMQHYARKENNGSFFYNKALYVHKDGFFIDEFAEDEIDFSDMKQAVMSQISDDVNEDEDDLFNEDSSVIFKSNSININSKDFNNLVKTAFIDNPNIKSKQNDNEDEDEDEDEIEEDSELKKIDVEDEFDENYIQITPAEKICLFKEHFDEYVEIMLERKGIPARKNNRERVFVQKGMRDWFNYVFSIISEIYEISSIEYDRSIKDLSYFI